MPMQSYTLLHLYVGNQREIRTLFARIENLTDASMKPHLILSNSKQGYNHSGRALYGGVRVQTDQRTANKQRDHVKR